LNSARNGNKGHEHAIQIVNREHFKLIYARNSTDVVLNEEAGLAVYNALSNKFGKENFRYDRYSQRGGVPDFPVLLRNEEIVSAHAESEVLNLLPTVSIDFVFCERNLYKNANRWFKENRNNIVPNFEGNN